MSKFNVGDNVTMNFGETWSDENVKTVVSKHRYNNEDRYVLSNCKATWCDMELLLYKEQI